MLGYSLALLSDKGSCLSLRDAAQDGRSSINQRGVDKSRVKRTAITCSPERARARFYRANPQQNYHPRLVGDWSATLQLSIGQCVFVLVIVESVREPAISNCGDPFRPRWFTQRTDRQAERRQSTYKSERGSSYLVIKSTSLFPITDHLAEQEGLLISRTDLLLFSLMVERCDEHWHWRPTTYPPFAY